MLTAVDLGKHLLGLIGEWQERAISLKAVPQMEQARCVEQCAHELCDAIANFLTEQPK